MSGNTASTKMGLPASSSSADSKSIDWATYVKPLASLKLTVTLFALSVFLVFAGTLAQVRLDIWDVMSEYFRSGIVWIDFQIFFPPSFFPSQPQVPGGFWFPGGWTIGFLLLVNLISAHGLTFKVQAKGNRLRIGLLVILVGIVATWLVIVSGSNKAGVQEATWISWDSLWRVFQVSLAVLFAVTVYGTLQSLKGPALQRWLMISATLLAGASFGLVLWLGDAGRLNDSGMRILWQLIKGTVAAGILLAGCVMVFRKRAGIVLLHAGVAMIMINELIVGVYAVETQMSLLEGETSNFARDIRTFELAVNREVDDETDETTVIPEVTLRDALQNNKTITHDDIPFDVRVVELMDNTSEQVKKVEPGEKTKATKGFGTQFQLSATASSTGTDTDSGVDRPAGYVQLLEKGTDKEIGTYLVSVIFAMRDLPQPVEFNGKVYDIALRFERSYKDYEITLLDVRKDDYVGTTTPRNFSSDIRLVDKTNKVDQDVHIWMNNPLRHAGETFYQQSYASAADTGTKEMTTLAIVTNAGWMIPYVACMFVAVGMFAHFGLTLLRFLGRHARETSTEASPTDGNETATVSADSKDKPKSDTPMWKNILVPALVIIVFGGYYASKARVPRVADGEMNLYKFGQTPVVEGGRPKPIDALARNTLLALSKRSTYYPALEEGAEPPPERSGFAKVLYKLMGRDPSKIKAPAIQWFLDMMAKPELAKKHPVFYIENHEIQEFLGIERRKGFLYAYDEFEKKVPDLTKATETAREKQKASQQLSLFDRKVLELEQKIGMYHILRVSVRLPKMSDTPGGIQNDFQKYSIDERKYGGYPSPLMLPPNKERPKWGRFTPEWLIAFVQSSKVLRQDPNFKSMPIVETDPESPIMRIAAIAKAYGENDAAAFNAAVDKNLTALKSEVKTANEKTESATVSLSKVRFESFFNQSSPFFYASWMYVVAFVFAALAWLGWNRQFNRAAFTLLCLTFVVHTAALVARIYISGRPPVTNLYSSAVFIGWGAVVIGLIFELVYKLGVGNVLAACSGYATLQIAYYLAADGDTFTVLQAVLDTQFWLATHVVCITFGYATTFVAGFLGILFILRGVFTKSLNAEVRRNLSRMIYGTLCFAIFFSFIGTVLGGLWADDSWGRFWGWDPKENGALIIVIWNALVLHARWGNLVKDRGMALLSVVGNIATAWSWFGVNELSIGLHAYGFTEGVLRALALFAISQMAIVIIGMWPKQSWRSHASE